MSPIISTLPFKTAKEILEASSDNATFPASSVMKVKNSLPKEGFVFCDTSDLHILVVEGNGFIHMKNTSDADAQTIQLTPQTVILIPSLNTFKIEGDVVIVLLADSKEEFKLMRG